MPALDMAAALDHVAEDILDHDHRGVDHQPKVKRADREQIGAFALQGEDQHRDRQRERNGGSHDQRAAQIAKEGPLQREDQHDPQRQVLQHGGSGVVDQLAAVIDPLQLDAGGQDAAGVDPVDLGLHRLNGRQAARAALHQDNALNDIVVAVIASNAKPRLVADLDRGKVLQQHRHPARAGDQHVLQPRNRLNQPDPANDGRLRAEVDGLPADIGVRVPDRLNDLRHRRAVRDQPAGIDHHLISAQLAAPAGDVDYPGNGLEAALQHPVLQGLEIHHRIARWAGDAVAIDLANRAGRRNLRLGPAGQRRKLGQPVDHALLRFLVAEIVGELHLDVG